MHAVLLQDSPYASICVTCCPSDERFFHFVDVKVNVMLSMFKSPILYLMHAIRKGKSFVWRKRRSRDDSAAIVSTLRVEVQFEVQIACKIKNLAAEHCSFFITGAKLSANNITNIHNHKRTKVQKYEGRNINNIMLISGCTSLRTQ